MAILKDVLDGFEPEFALVLGSGLGALVEAVNVQHTRSYEELDGFPVSAVSGHAGTMTAGVLNGRNVIVLSGRAHYYEQGNAAAMRPPLQALKDAGVQKLILTNSAGSMDKKMGPGSVMQIKDHINYSGLNPLIGEPTDKRFVGMTTAYDRSMRKAFRKVAKREGIKLYRGVYAWYSGPSFETPAEIKMLRKLGSNAVGMSTVPEVILGRFFDMEVAAFSVITNYAAGMTGNELSHSETKEMAPKGGEKLVRLISSAFQEGL